ncbi:MAG: hypothetical protein MUO73_01000 [Thermoplasmata archaeon]|nr:hypothetical protein [Thermoplasmata archaeon]
MTKEEKKYTEEDLQNVKIKMDDMMNNMARYLKIDAAIENAIWEVESQKKDRVRFVDPLKEARNLCNFILLQQPQMAPAPEPKKEDTEKDVQ